MSDPKGAAGAAKVPFAMLPWAVIAEMALGHGEGGVKYGPHNWRESGGVNASTYRAAAMRHLVADMLGEEIDPDSGLPHIVKAMCSLAVLRDARIHGVAIEDGPPASAAGFMAAIGAQWTATRASAEAARQAMARPGPCTVCGGAGTIPNERARSARARRRCPMCQPDPHKAMRLDPGRGPRRLSNERG